MGNNKKYNRILVTSALPYANGPLHLGHLAGCYLPADIFTRYHRKKGTDIIHICGSDEHGVAITIKAEKESISPQELVDKYHAEFKENFEEMGISFDHYSRTSTPLHHQTAKEFFLNVKEHGYLEEKELEQFYCPKCKRFLADRYIEGTCPHCGNENARGDQCEKCGKWLEPIELIAPKCKVCGSPPILKKTIHYFLRLDKLQPQIENWQKNKTHWKDNVKEFCSGWFKQGLQPRAITRDLSWGVQVPGKEKEGKVLYVWFDAPIGYITSTKEWAQKTGNPEKWRTYWQKEDTRLVHFIGKDNIVFHAIVWPGMIMAEGNYILPDDIPANEFLNIEGDKISTSRNFAIWVKDYLKNFKPDPLRYTLAANAPETKDADFSWNSFKTRNNSELADILGNFINRTAIFINKYFDGIIPIPKQLSEEDQKTIDQAIQFIDETGTLYDNFSVRKAAFNIMELARIGNRYFDYAKPWETIKKDKELTAQTLYVCSRIAAILSYISEPIIPFSAKKIQKIFSIPNISWDDMKKFDFNPNTKIGKTEVLFPKIEDKTIEKEKEKLYKPNEEAKMEENKKLSQEEPKKEESTNIITIDDFKKIDLRVAKIIEVEKIENADKLLKLQLQIGEEQRQIVAGIAPYYKPEELLGRKIVVVYNLKPAKLRGVESNGMLLAASNKDRTEVVFLTPEKDIEDGSRIS